MLLGGVIGELQVRFGNFERSTVAELDEVEGCADRAVELLRLLGSFDLRIPQTAAKAPGCISDEASSLIRTVSPHVGLVISNALLLLDRQPWRAVRVRDPRNMTVGLLCSRIRMCGWSVRTVYSHASGIAGRVASLDEATIR